MARFGITRPIGLVIENVAGRVGPTHFDSLEGAAAATDNSEPVVYAIAPWLSVRNSAQAVEFYKAAFGATEVFRLDGEGDGVVSRLSVHGAEFWLSDESPEHGNFSPASLGGGSVRLILTVPDPDAVIARALAAGAVEVFPVVEGHGWRVGRVVDPYGHHWEIGRPLAE